MTNPLVRNPGSVAALVDDVRAGRRPPGALVEASLARIAEVEPTIQAWIVLDEEGARRAAAEMAGAPLSGLPLAGLPVAIKDVIDVEGLPTRAGSGTRRNAAPAAGDAEIVRGLREAGAIVIGKVHTTEFALFDGPPPTRNPHDTACTPGGSSAGPAAAVASGMVPAAIGTQTAASLSRPAAYCGIGAFKPTMGSTNTAGVVPIAHSLDTVGFYGYRLADAVALFEAAAPLAMRYGPTPPLPDAVKIVVIEDPLFEEAQPAVAGSLAAAADALADAGRWIERRPSPTALTPILAWHKTISEYEMARVHGGVLDAPADQSTDGLKAALERGREIALADYLTVRRDLAAARRTFWDGIGEDELLLLPPVPAPAPRGTATGDPRFIIPLNALAGPIASIPTVADPDGLPLGVMLGDRPGRDGAFARDACAIAEIVEAAR